KSQHLFVVLNLSRVVLTAVCNSIQHPVTKEILFEFLDRCAQVQSRKHSADSELMPPPPPKRANHTIP
ncbi:hypothetical protein M9458_039500, partial [Cirrhinus mrigala]